MTANGHRVSLTVRSLWSVLLSHTASDDRWRNRFTEFSQRSGGRLHIAVFQEPFLSLVLDGKKSVESRFSRNRIAPYQQVRECDIILIKEPSGPVVAIAEVSSTGFYQLNADAWKEIRSRFEDALAVPDEGFWYARRNANYASVIGLADVERIQQFWIDKRDRRGWVSMGYESAPIQGATV